MKKGYNLLIMGPPGSGKGTQAKFLEEKFRIKHISTGDIFREKSREDSETGRRIKGLIDSGQYVPDDVTISIVKEKLSEAAGYLLDGFPRTVEQANALDSFSKVDYVIYVDVPDAVLIDRISNRLMCKCGESYNLATNPPKKKGVCNKCNDALYQREDDNAKKLKVRLANYREKTEPLLEHYKDRLLRIDGTKSIEEVSAEIIKKMNTCKKK